MEEGCIVIQTCDKYQPIWKSLLWSMEKYWDFEIPWPIYFCNEEIDVKFKNSKYRQIKTGRMKHSEMISRIMSELRDYKYIFYMLDDFWPTDRMSKEIFMGLFKIFKDNNWDSLKVTAYQPMYYDVEGTSFHFNGKKILRYKKSSNWRFNQQASFWKREIFENIVSEPDEMLLEEKTNTSLGTEQAMDKKFRELYPDAEVYLYNYIWYPVSGAMWRGGLTLIGEQIEFEIAAEEFAKIKFG